MKASTANRLRHILTVLFEAGGGAIIGRMRLGYLVPMRCRVRGVFRRKEAAGCLVRVDQGSRTFISPVVLRQTLERLGPSFVKLGQVLSLRADIVGLEFSQELSRLQDEALPFPYAQVKQVVQAELGGTPEEVFKSFEEKPVAAASLSQVHRAFLPNGDEVAVKVQRPNIRRTFEQDIEIVYYLAHLAERFVPESRPYHPARVVDQYADWTRRELDFSAEGRNADRFRFMFQRNEHVRVPRIYWAYTTPRVLTMEFIHGVKATNRQGMESLRIDRAGLARHGVNAMLEQFLVHGFFHADPHPGNMFIGESETMWLYDFGMVGYLSQAQRSELIGCFVSVDNKNIEGFTKHFLHLAVIDHKSDVAKFRKDIAQDLSSLFYSEQQVSMARVFFNLINRGARLGVGFPADLVLFGKSLLTVERMGAIIYPEFSFNQAVRPFISRIWKDYLGPRRLYRNLGADIFDLVTMLRSAPEQLRGVMSRIEKGEIRVPIDEEQVRKVTSALRKESELRFLGTALVGTLLAFVLLVYLEGHKTIVGLSLSQFTLAVFGLVLALLIFRVRYIK